MPLVSCPDCGAQVSDTAVVCPRCGFPLRRDLLTRGGGRRAGSGTNTTGIVIALVVGGFMLVVVIGILAALAIPRFAGVAARAKELEGESVLRLAFTFENTFYRDNGRYTRSFEELKSVGWQEPPMMRYYTLEIAVADSSDLCLHALPRPGSGVQPIRMHASGTMDRGLRCDQNAKGEDRVTAEARGLLRDVYGGVAEWRRGHGRLPETQAELVQAYPGAADDPDFAMGLTPVASGGLCVHVAPRAEPPAPVVLSLDGGGNVYAGDGCGGKPLEQLQR
jgi:Tfp pilus assembly protein PilE